MSAEPVVAFGQQPCGFFPRRFLVAKIRTARRLQAELGGRVVYFCHDSDHDPRETRTILRHRATGQPAYLNFAVGSKLQRKFSPLYAKRIAPDWHARTLAQLPNYVDSPVIDLFRRIGAETVADFCLAMYRGMGLLDGVDVVRSSDPEVRRRAYGPRASSCAPAPATACCTCTRAEMRSSRCRRPPPPLPRTRSARPGTRGCGGCSR
jgi:hypothetical protein